MSSLASNTDVLWYSREKDATWLAAQLRSSRLTILQGRTGSGKSTLLRYGLMLRLSHRVTDPPPAVVATSPDVPRPERPARPDGTAASRVVIPFPDRRRGSRAGSAAHDPEVVIYIDAWEGRPLETLWSAVHKSLGLPPSALPHSPSVLVDALLGWHAERGVRFLFVLDDFDECLKASTTVSGSREFVDQWVRAVNHPRAPAHFLVAMSEPAEPLWELLARHHVGLGELADHRLQLAGASPEAYVRQSTVTPFEQPRVASARDAAAVESDTQAVGIEPTVDAPSSRSGSTLGKTAGGRAPPVPVEPPARGVPPPFDPNDFVDPVDSLGRYRAEDVTSTSTAAEANEAIRKAMRLAMGTADAAARGSHPEIIGNRKTPLRHPARRLQKRAKSRWPSAVLICGAVVVVAGLAYGAWDRFSSDRARLALPSASLPPGTRSTPSTPSDLPTPGFELVADAGDSSDDAMVSDLAQALTPAGYAAPTIRFPFGWVSEIGLLNEQPRLTTASVDVLQAARQLPNAAPLQVVTPLFSQEIYFLVRSDSRLHSITQIRSAKMNIGPARGSRALTANGVFQKMFGISIPQKQIVTSSREEALDQLLTTRAIDVLVLVGAQPDPWLQRLSPERQRALRLLEIDPKTNMGRRAIAAYPPTQVKPDHGSGIEPAAGISALSTMTFLVTGDSRSAVADQQISAAATALCTNLPALQQSSHGKWRDVKLGAQIDTGWPTSSAAREAFANCRQ